MTPSERGDKLRSFYLSGLPDKGVGPVISVDNFSSGAGQIRTNEFLHQGGASGLDWTLREFKIQKLLPGIRIVPVTVKTNPDASLFSGTAPIDLQVQFVDRIVDQMTNLRGGPGGNESKQTFSLSLGESGDDRFNPFESQELNAPRGSVAQAFKPTSLLGAYITQKLAELGNKTSLTSADIVQRVQTQTCAGCHQWSNNQPLGAGAGNWPSSLQFVHVSEKDSDIETVNGIRRHKISDTLKSSQFIPLRCQIIADFLNVSNAQCGP
jgi:hypothetical protein